jgi:regulator of sigma E protease
VVFVAGPLANVVLAFVILTVGFMVGWPERVALDRVMGGSPAEAAGLQAGDLVITANGMPIRYPDALGNIGRANLGKPVKLVIQRSGETLDLTVIPDTDWSAGAYPLGVEMRRSVVSYPLHIALVRAGEELANQFKVTAETLWKLAQGSAAAAPAEETRVVGIIGLKQISDRAVENSVEWGEWFPILQLTAFVSAALGIANLLPLPALDGGRIVFTIVEMIRRQRLNPKFERWANITGLIALIILMVVLMAKDIAEPIF